MYTQNTPVHIKLWHRDFLKVSASGFLLSTAVYTQVGGYVPVMQANSFTAVQMMWCVMAFVLGMLMAGGFCNYLIQRFRRNKVCGAAMAGTVAVMVLMYMQAMETQDTYWSIIIVFLLRLLLGACYGVAWQTLASTLFVDIADSFRRTQTFYAASWMLRLPLAVGPAAAISLMMFWRPVPAEVFLLGAVLAAAAWLLLHTVTFPFKAPDDGVSVYGLDRFLLPQGMPLILSLAMFMLIIGLMLGCAHSLHFYLMLLAGMVVAVLAEQYVFMNADLRSQVVTGLILIMAALFIELVRPQRMSTYVVPLLAGISVGIVSSRYLLFLIKLAKHCQRGTAQSSFFISWEAGLWTGIALSIYSIGDVDIYDLLNSSMDKHPDISIAGLMLAAASLILYCAFVHPWYMKNKNR